jgi:hypothetical protein
MKTRKWTLEGLVTLVEALEAIAFKDTQGLYFGTGSLQDAAGGALEEEGVLCFARHAGVGLGMLVFFEALDATKAGLKPRNYKRRFYPEKVRAITQDDLERFRASTR